MLNALTYSTEAQKGKRLTDDQADSIIDAAKAVIVSLE